MSILVLFGAAAFPPGLPMGYLDSVALQDGTTATQKALIDALGRIAAFQPDIVASGTITTQNLTPTAAATAGSAVLSGALDGRSLLCIQITGTYTAVGGMFVQATNDGTTWVSLGGTCIQYTSNGSCAGSIISATVGFFQCQVAGFAQVRVTATGVVSGTATVTLRVTNGTGAVSVGSPLPAGTQTLGATTALFTALTTTNAYLNSAASTNATSVKTSAGNLYHVSCSNSDTTDVWLKLYNKASSPSVGTDLPVLTIKVAAGTDITRTFSDFGCRFSTGIAAAITGAAGDSDTTAISAAKTKVIFGYA